MCWPKGKKKLKLKPAYKNIIPSDSSREIIKSQLGASDCDYYISTYGGFRGSSKGNFETYKDVVFQEGATEAVCEAVKNLFKHIGNTIPLEIILFAGFGTCQAFYRQNRGTIRVFADITVMDRDGRDLQNAVVHELIHGIRDIMNLVPDNKIFKVSFIEEAAAVYYARYMTGIQHSLFVNPPDVPFAPLFDEVKKIWNANTDDVFYNFFCSGKIHVYSHPGFGYCIADRLMELYARQKGAVNILEKNSVLQKEIYKRLGK